MDKNQIKRIEEASAAIRNATTDEEKEEARNNFWTEAITAFNENVAGEVVTVTGERLYTPPIEM